MWKNEFYGALFVTTIGHEVITVHKKFNVIYTCHLFYRFCEKNYLS